LFPRFSWDQPTDTSEPVDLGNPPKLLGVPRHQNKTDNKDTRLPHGVALYAPVHWYLQQIEWEVLVPNSATKKIKEPLRKGLSGGLSPDAGTSWAELAVDFLYATHVSLKPRGETESGELADQTRIFTNTAHRVAEIAGKSPTPCAPWKTTRSLRRLQYQFLNGVAGKAKLLCPRQTREFFARHQLTVGGRKEKQGHLHWIPKLGTLPPAQWNPNDEAAAPEAVRVAVSKSKLTGPEKKQFAEVIGKIALHNKDFEDQNRHHIIVPDENILLDNYRKPANDRAFPDWTCRNCARTEEWKRMSVFRKQTCVHGNALRHHQAKALTELKAKVEEHNVVAEGAELHCIIAPDEQHTRTQLAKPAAERTFLPFRCTLCAKEAAWKDFRGFRRQECEGKKAPRVKPRAKPSPGISKGKVPERTGQKPQSEGGQLNCRKRSREEADAGGSGGGGVRRYRRPSKEPPDG
jgi:hypothetical protein